MSSELSRFSLLDAAEDSAAETAPCSLEAPRQPKTTSLLKALAAAVGLAVLLGGSAAALKRPAAVVRTADFESVLDQSVVAAPIDYADFERRFSAATAGKPYETIKVIDAAVRFAGAPAILGNDAEVAALSTYYQYTMSPVDKLDFDQQAGHMLSSLGDQTGGDVSEVTDLAEFNQRFAAETVGRTIAEKEFMVTAVRGERTNFATLQTLHEAQLVQSLRAWYLHGASAIEKANIDQGMAALLLSAGGKLCSQGHRLSSGECEACGQGYFQESDHSASTQCAACPEGRYGESTGSSACASCPKGKYQDGTGGAGQSSCKPCLEGETSPLGARACVSCPPGRASNADRSFCVACPPGQSFLLGVCTSCPAGRMASADGAVCEACPAGAARAASELTGCIACPEGEKPNTDKSGCGGQVKIPMTIKNVEYDKLKADAAIESRFIDKIKEGIADTITGVDKSSIRVELHKGSVVAIAKVAVTPEQDAEMTLTIGDTINQIQSAIEDKLKELPPPVLSSITADGETISVEGSPPPAYKALCSSSASACDSKHILKSDVGNTRCQKSTCSVKKDQDTCCADKAQCKSKTSYPSHYLKNPGSDDLYCAGTTCDYVNVAADKATCLVAQGQCKSKTSYPTGYIKKSGADDAYCAGATCDYANVAADKAACLVEKAKCKSKTSGYPHGYIKKSGADDAYCAGATCDYANVAADKAACLVASS